MKQIIKPDSKLGITLAKANVQLRAKAPTICLVTGIVGTAAAMFFTVKAGMKTQYILDERQAKIDDIEDAYENQEELSQPYTEDEKIHDIKVANKRAVLDFARIYSLPVGLYLISMVLICEGHHILQKRNAVLSTAVAAAQTAMAGYRKRVASFVGEDVENDIYNGAVKKTEVDEETGEIKEYIERESTQRLTDRIFDESNGNWDAEKWRNQTFLYKTEEYLNEMLVARACGSDGIGFVFLNEVYANLGFDKTPEGYQLGWYYEEGIHESHIDFGLSQMDTPHRLFANGHEKSVWLNFNYDGDIMSVINKRHIKTIA